MLGHQSFHLRLDFPAVVGLGGLQVVQGFLEDPLVGVQRPVALDCILDHVLNLDPGGLQGHQDGTAPHFGSRPRICSLWSISATFMMV